MCEDLQLGPELVTLRNEVDNLKIEIDRANAIVSQLLADNKRLRAKIEDAEPESCTDAEHDFGSNGCCRRCGAVGLLAYQFAKEGQK